MYEEAGGVLPASFFLLSLSRLRACNNSVPGPSLWLTEAVPRNQLDAFRLYLSERVRGWRRVDAHEVHLEVHERMRPGVACVPATAEVPGVLDIVFARPGQALNVLTPAL